MFLYIATSSDYRSRNLFKLGMTEDHYGRRSTYQTSCPPLHPDLPCDIVYDMVWETDALDRDQLFGYEDILHNQFIKFRMMRHIPGDSEWFDFTSKPRAIEIISEFMSTMPWVKREVPLSEIVPIKRPSRHLRVQHAKNTNFIDNIQKRNEMLNQIQEPVVQTIRHFISHPEVAGYIIAPCGSGKTRMACNGIKGQHRVVVCCPSATIQAQWVSTIVSLGVFTYEHVLTIGSSNSGTTNLDTIRSFLQQDVYCIITTYMSSNLLVSLLTDRTQILLLDEAHHLGGIVGNDNDNEGEGKTRRLMMKATDLQVKRLSLTFTPRIVDSMDDVVYASMDDERIFGSQIAELKIRDLIRKGVLPDYRIWSLRDSSKKGAGVLGKADCIIESWDAKHVVRGAEEYILHHLVIFASTNEEARQIAAYIESKTQDTLIVCVKGGDELDGPIRHFSEAKRAIIVNCKVLGEGVDIPIVNAVAFTYPKHSCGEITQMILRAGRWYPNKSLFHILLPIVDDDDMSGFENVLAALASCDTHLRDEIILQHKADLHTPTHTREIGDDAGMIADCIMIEDYDGSSAADIHKCFINIRRNMFQSHKRIQELGIDTSVEYMNIRNNKMPELPEDPKPKTMTWYDYLHPRVTERISVHAFVTDILEANHIRVGHEYDTWYVAQSTKLLPSLQNINDGYFGAEYTNFNELRARFGKRTGGGRR